MRIFPRLIHCLFLTPLVTFGQISKEVTLTLVDDDDFNEVKIEVDVDAIGESDDTSELTGTITVRVNIFPDKTTTDEMTVLSADVAGSDIALSAGNFIASYEFDGKDLGFSAKTIEAPGVVDLATGEFDAAQHEVTVGEGTLEGSASTILTGTQDVDFDFADEAFTGPGEGTGSVTITPGRVEDRKLYYNITLELPAKIDQSVEVEGVPVEADVKVDGILKASGETFIEIPDFTSWATAAGINSADGNAFDLSPSIPNQILFALGFDDQSAPDQLFDFSPAGIALKVNQDLAAAALEIQWSDDLTTWERVPEEAMISGSSAIEFGDSLSAQPVVKAEGQKKYLRVSAVAAD